MNIQGWFTLGLTGLISLLSKGLLRVFSRTTIQKHQFFSAQPSLQLVTQMVKNLSSMQETWVWSLSQENSLEKGMAIHSSILAWRIPWTEAWWAMVHGLKSVGHNWARMQLVIQLNADTEIYFEGKVPLLSNTFIWKGKSLSRVQLLVTPWTILSMEFFRQEYWSG